MTQTEAMNLALETLERASDSGYSIECDEAIAAIKEALAQPQQEPLEYWNAVEGWVKLEEAREHLDSVGCGTIYKTAGEGRVPLCIAQPQQEPYGYFKAEPFGWTDCAETDVGAIALYTTPPQRKPLTDEEINQIADEFIVNYRIPAGSHYDFARAIEAAHGIKE